MEHWLPYIRHSKSVFKPITSLKSSMRLYRLYGYILVTFCVGAFCVMLRYHYHIGLVQGSFTLVKSSLPIFWQPPSPN